MNNKSTGQLSQLLFTSKIASIYLSTKLQYSFLTFIASLLMVTDKDSLSEVAQYVPHSVFESLHCFQRNLISYLYFTRVDHFLIITSGFYTKFLSLLKVICVDSYMFFCDDVHLNVSHRRIFAFLFGWFKGVPAAYDF